MSDDPGERQMNLTILHHCRVWDGDRAVPEENVDVVVEEHRIKEVCDTPVKAANAREIDAAGRTLMPGLIDAHVHACVHLVGFRPLEETPPTLMALQAAAALRQMLMRGFTTVRDCGGADWGLAKAVERGIIAGPRLFHSGRGLSQTGGHGDYRYRTGAGFDPCGCASALDHVARIADGTDEVRKAARDELRKGAKQIKVMVSGGLTSPYDPIENRQFAEEELKAIVQEAEAWRTYVAAHAYTADAVRHALRCGVRSIEHANLIDRETAAAAALKGAFVVPTLATFEALGQHGREHGLAAASTDEIKGLCRKGMEAVEMCRDAGVRLGFGTDLLGPLREHQTRGILLQAEVQGTVAALSSATLVNANLIGMRGELGVVKAGAIADLLLVDGDPLADPALLDGQGERLSLIMKNGEICKNALHG